VRVWDRLLRESQPCRHFVIPILIDSINPDKDNGKDKNKDKDKDKD
jgi:hypothetical protein